MPLVTFFMSACVCNDVKKGGEQSCETKLNTSHITIKWITIKGIKIKYHVCILHYSAVKQCAMQYWMLQGKTVYYNSAIQCSTMHFSAVSCTTLYYSALHCSPCSRIHGLPNRAEAKQKTLVFYCSQAVNKSALLSVSP